MTTTSREPATDAVVRVLVENHRRFLAFLERRVGSRDAAEDILQDAFVREEVCACVSALAKTLKPEYATAIQRVDLDGVAVAAFARETGITPNNAAVRLHRAHDALRRQVVKSCGTCAQHGCLDCRCGSPTQLR